YEQAPTYRRTLVLVDVGVDEAYLVDVFRVQGGSDHVLSLHGQDGTFELTGPSLPPPVTEGTLAGPDVAYGELYDDPVLGAPDYQGPFYSYHGSGYSHLFNWQSVVPSTVVTGQWTLSGEPAGVLRVHIAPYPGQELVVADAYASPRRIIPAVLKYLLLRRVGSLDGNTFAVVWELASSPLIDQITVNEDPALGLGKDRVVVLAIQRGSVTDTISVAPQPAVEQTISPTITSDAAVTLLSRENVQWGRRFAAGGTHLSATQPDLAVTIPPTIRGPITAADYAARTLTADIGALSVDGGTLAGSAVRLFNDTHSSLYTIGQAQLSGTSLTLTLAGSDVLTGRVNVGTIDYATKSGTLGVTLMYPFSMAGMRLVTSDLAHTARIASADDSGSFQLVQDADIGLFADDMAAGRDLWVADFGVGDQIEIERFAFGE
ncbi:MAG TPA: hypothetical protein VMV94_11425, partial [Phycisphaerae bacterium]|nr:hypothetical protein [Phycisphaerae bacterium]